MLQVAVYRKENGIISVGFVIPATGDSNGMSVVASEYKEGCYGGPHETVFAADWLADIHVNEKDDGSYCAIDASNTQDIKILSAR